MLTAGIDVGSTYTKAVLVSVDGAIAGRAVTKTGFRLDVAAARAFDAALANAGASAHDVRSVVATGYGRHRVSFADSQVTDLAAAARGATLLFPRTRTILDVGGQTIKATRVDERAKIRAFRLNDTPAAGTGALLEKTAEYLGYSAEQINLLAAMPGSRAASVGGCRVFADSEVVNHLSHGTPPSDILQGAINSLVDRSVQLLERVQLSPEYTLVGGMLRFDAMARVLADRLGSVNVPSPDVVQLVGAIGAAQLGQRRLRHAAVS